MLKLNEIYNYDCLSGLKLLDDNSIDAVITSPPYGELREYNGFPSEKNYLIEVITELYRVIKIGGVVVWVTSDQTKNYSESGESFKQALSFIKYGFCLYDTMIFGKNNPLSQNKKRYEQEFEYMFVFSKGKIKTFNPILIPCKHAGRKRSGTMRHNAKAKLEKKHTLGHVKTKKTKGNIWYYDVGSNCTSDKDAHKHPAIFPDKLAEDHILSWTNCGDIILDIFMGSGTVGKMATANNRNFIGFEISQEYCDLANTIITRYKQEQLTFFNPTIDTYL